MNNLHRELAPVSAAAWSDMEDEARRTFASRVAARRTVDMPEPAGAEFSAVGTGHVSRVDSDASGVETLQRHVVRVVELRAPFTVRRADVDSVERGATDADWQPVKDAAVALASAEDRTVFYGSQPAGIQGIAPASDNPRVALPQDVREFPDAVAKARTELRLAGVSGPYNLLLPAELYTEVTETTDHGYPVHEHVSRILGDGSIIWAPALDDALLVSARGGDYELHLGLDTAIGYSSHTAETVELYLRETLTFRVNTSEASVVIAR
ncbi:family 1 encapsulin nanocompartment shell protein [Kocuria sp.]|uniref:family 1 encapsulin nanocompartment shell protein n=1 Tax=Kocuria sp. TaxID=1871328 RepID=UPI0026DD7D87|nr:family 1 encapsulin nanocompartment shell protein [Kocuria sp.]MDO4918999.1 family 1 encapsulin nanocompartment shell protein [Kocuria sp.]